MSLLETMTKAIGEAMKARDQTRLSTLRLLKTALMNKEIERGHTLQDAEELQVVTTLVKQRRESIVQFEAGKRADLAAREAAEITVLEEFLPPAMSEEDIRRLVDQVVTETGASSAKDLGRVMKVLMPKLAGSGADGKLVNDLVHRRLG